MIASEGGRVTGPGRVGSTEHNCDGECSHGKGRRRSERLELATPLGAGDLGRATVGESLRIVAGEWAFGIELREREERDDGVVAVLGETSSGGMFHALSDGLNWEGRIVSADHREAWILRGGEIEATIEHRTATDFVCTDQDGGPRVGGLPSLSLTGPELAEASAPGALELGEAAPILNSLPNANGVIYLDFDGEVVKDKFFNEYFNISTINAAGSGFSNTQIQTVWERVAEDFRPFNVNVTTDLTEFTAAAKDRRVRVIFTPTNEWYGSAGGVAFIGTFGSSFYDEPAFVFTDQLLYNNAPHAPWAAEAASHEAGHTLDLNHDGAGSSGYYDGHGSGETSWAPIMGASYQVRVSQWSQGDYSGATNDEDDLAIIAGSANGLGYRADDHADSRGAAGPMPDITNGGVSVSGSGVIETRGDVDVFEFQTGAGVVSFAAENDPTDPNLDIAMRILSASGEIVAEDDPGGSLDANIDVDLAAGTYYLEIEGVGTGTWSTGYDDYGSLGSYSFSGTLIADLSVEIISPSLDAISLPEGTGLLLAGAASGGSPQWSVLSSPPGGSATLSSPSEFATDCVFEGTGVYELRLEVTDQALTKEDILTVSVESAGTSKVYSNRGTGVGLGGDAEIYRGRATLHPELMDDSVPGADLLCAWEVQSGPGVLSDSTAEQPELQFSAAGPVDLRLEVDDGEIVTFNEVTLHGMFHSEVVLESGAAAFVHVPTDGSLGDTWKNREFDDATWTAGLLGVGFNANDSPPESELYQGLIGAGLDVEHEMYSLASSCYVRIPFELSVPDAVQGFELRVSYDDGFVAYLNGTEVARANVPAGTPSWNSLASSDRDDSAGESAVKFTFSVPAGLLVDGTNVLAIHGLNASSFSDDYEFLLHPELDALVSDLPFLASVASIPDAAQRGYNDDPDRDGKDNLAEHAAGTDPNVAEAQSIIDVLDGAEELNVDVCIRLPLLPPADVRYDLQFRNRLTDAWATVATRVGSSGWTGVQPGAPQPDGPGHEVFIFDESEIGESYWRVHLSRIALPDPPLVAP